jgi:fucose 4-O-acetylase-like acetyltransferase
MTARTASVDVARGALMLYIVSIIHGLFWFGWLSESVRSAFLFEIPCLFIVSGYAYFLYENAPGRLSPLQGFSTYLSFLAARCSRILVPYFAYAIVCLTICIFLRGSQGMAECSIGNIVFAWLNPMIAGLGYSMGTLSLHLWFIAPFLAVTAALPFLTKIRLPTRIPLWGFMIGFSLVIHFLSLTQFPGSGFLQSIVNFSIWAIFGFHAARQAGKLGYRDYLPVFFFASFILLASRLIHPEPFSLNMTKNKFPPNFAFFIFNCAWVSLLLMLSTLLDSRWIIKLSNAIWLKPFITSGYSIYLWQGVGYTAGIHLGRVLGLPISIVWVVAIVLSTMLGMLAAPLERIRIRL